MDNKLEKELFCFFDKALGDQFDKKSLEELKCLDWLVVDADPFIKEKNKKVA